MSQASKNIPAASYHVRPSRVRSGFLFWPRSIHGDRRWLVKARWIEYQDANGTWRPLRWLDPGPRALSVS